MINTKDLGFNILEVVRKNAAEKPDSVAFVFLADGEVEQESLTFEQLDKKVQVVAKSICTLCSPGDRALLVYPQGLDFIVAFLACLLAGVIAIPVPAPETGRLKRSLPRLKAIIDDAKASLLLADKKTLESFESQDNELSFDDLLTQFDTTQPQLDLNAYTFPLNFEIKPESLAYLQYTSGSTTRPKGVMLSHANLYHYLRVNCEVFNYTPNTISVTWLPHFHDMGLVEGILAPLFNGTTCYIMSAMAFVKKPIVWLKAISQYGATHTQAPNFAYERCVLRIDVEQQRQLDLSKLQVAANGAEPINSAVMLKFYEKFRVNGFKWEAFCPGYGLAESTLGVSVCPPKLNPKLGRFNISTENDLQIFNASEGADANVIVSCGCAFPETEIVIVNYLTDEKCSNNQIGEVWLKNNAVAVGYWGQPELSKKILRAQLKNSDNNGNTYLRTGDLGFLWENELYITGRLKDLIIIDGVNITPHDIEWLVELCHPALYKSSATVVFSIPVDGRERICVVMEQPKGFSDYDELWLVISQALSEQFELKLYQLIIVNTGSIPKTSSGKLQRRVCKSKLLTSALSPLWSKTAQLKHEVDLQTDAFPIISNPSSFEAWLVVEVAKIAKVGVDSINVDAPITKIGLDSIDTLTFACVIEDKINKKILMAEIVGDGITIKQLASKLLQLEWKPSNSCLVPIQPKGTKPPLFCVHPAGGNVIGYSALANHLGDEQPFYGLQAIGLDGNQEPLESIEEMAKHYLSEIKTVQSSGPYLLCGMCLGGIIAYEMAQQLQVNNEEVAFLGLIDPRNPPALLNALLQPNILLFTDADKLYTERTAELEKLVAEARNKPAISIPAGVVPNDPVLKRVFTANLQARDKYTPKTYNKAVDFFWANQTPGDLGFYHDPRVGWAQLVDTGLKIHPLNANHFELINEPHISELANLIHVRLEECTKPELVCAVSA